MHEDARPLDVLEDDRDVDADQRPKGLRRIARRHGAAEDVGGGGLEPPGRPVDDRPEDILLRRDVGVQAGALDVEGACDVAHAGARVPALVEERARRRLDLPSSGRLDHVRTAS